MKSLHSFYEVALVCVRKGGKLSAEKSQKRILTLQKGLICSPEFAIEFKIGIHIDTNRIPAQEYAAIVSTLNQNNKNCEFFFSLSEEDTRFSESM